MKIVHLCIIQYGVFVCTAYFYKDELYLRRVYNDENAGIMFFGKYHHTSSNGATTKYSGGHYTFRLRSAQKV